MIIGVVLQNQQNRARDQALEAAGAEIRVRSLVGSTGLLMACRRGHKEVVEWWLTREVSTLL